MKVNAATYNEYAHLGVARNTKDGYYLNKNFVDELTRESSARSEAKRQASRVANEANAIDSAQNSEFLDGERAEINTAEITASKDEPLLHAEHSQRDYATKSSSAQIMTAKEFATKEVGLDEDTATNVLKEAMQGKEKSEFIDADSYNDIVKFKNFEVQREYAKAYGEKIQTAQTSINNVREQSAIRYADTQKAINEYQKQGMSPSATRELINAKFKPSADEIDYTRAYNDGVDVDARLAGQGIFYALEKDIAAQAYTPEIYATRLKQRGFSDESVQAFTQAYASKDIDIAKEYVNEKVADAYESRVQREVADEINSENRISINKNGAYRQHPMLRPDEPSIWQGSLKNDYAQIVKNIASDRNIALRLDPNADILAIVKDFSQPIKTPIFTSKISVDKMLNHLADKADGERRLEYINLIKPTLENPLFITQETINGAQRFRFFKTFIDDKDKVVKFLNVVEDKNGELLEITATPIKNTDLKNLLNGKIIWGGDALSDLSSPRTAKRGLEADATIISQKGNLINETTKQEDLSSLRAKIERENNIVPIKEFGTNYAEFYHDGKGAIDKLLTEREGQVAGAFYRKELGDIDLVWGKVWQDQKGTLQGYGLAKIKAKHPEVTAEILNDVIKNGQTKIRQNEAIQIEKDGYKVVLKNNWMGEKTSNKWIVTAYEKSGETSSVSSDAFTKGDNLPSTAEIKGDVANLSAYSDEFKGELASSHPPLTNKNIISQKGNLINEEAKNSALPNGVSSIGDNASRAGGRQGGDEEILRQSGRNTADASEEKWTAKSDRQMEQRPAFKTDGDTDATASSKQMVEKQGRDDNEIRGENFITMQSPAPKSDLNVKVSVDDWVRELSEINNNELSANLFILQNKHPELFKKPSDVYRLLKEIKNNPTHFLKTTVQIWL